MKIHFFLFAIFLFGCKAQPDAVRKVHDKMVAPPGTVWLRDSLYMDQTEIKNLDYVEYISWLYQNDRPAYTAALPDTTVWRDKQSYNEPYVEYYLRHPAYRDYPVVGVSYEQAVDYCKWRTARVKEFVKIAGKENAKKYAIYKNIEYRLPTKEEWEYAASAGSERSVTKAMRSPIAPQYGYERLLASNNLPKVWVKESLVFYQEGNGNDIFFPAKSGYPNSFGFYNMIGNVAEMIAEKGISKGGSTFNPLAECGIDNQVPYTKPSAGLGFRCVCEVKK